MIKLTIVLFVAALFFNACNEKRENNQTIPKEGLYKEVALNPGGDTNFVVIEHSNIRWRIHYYKNKPQTILLQHNPQADNLLPHYIRDEKGVLIGINAQSNKIDYIGYSYLRQYEGVDVAIDSLGAVENFSIWEEYKNEGKIYLMKETKKGKIIAYIIKAGEKTDSIIYIKNK